MRVLVDQMNATPGAWDANMQNILQAAREGKHKEVDLIVLPELALPGYGYKDEYHKGGIISQVEKVESSLRDVLLKENLDVPILFGSLTRQDTIKSLPGIEDVSNKPYNSGKLWWIEDGKIVEHNVHKAKLPNDGVFDEIRTFTPGDDNQVRRFELPSGHTVSIIICAELWDIEWLLPKLSNCDLIVSINASDWYPEKLLERLELAVRVSSETHTPLIYDNMCTGQDGILFDGTSFMMTNKQLNYLMPEFWVGRTVFETTSENSTALDFDSRISRIRDGLVFGLKEYIHKNNFKKAVLGLSGGIDSSLVAVLAAEALGAENVTGFALPTIYNSYLSEKLAEELANNLNIEFKIVEIQEAFQVMDSLIQSFAEGFGLPQQNLQSRIRANILMAYANSQNAINLGCSNKSECFVGYSTLFGDTAAGYFPIADLTKTDIYALANFLNEEYGYNVIPSEVITRAPTAELAEGQMDNTDLPDYDIIDAALRVLVEDSVEHVPSEELAKIKYLFERSEYKRKVLAPLTKISKKSFGPDWRKPITRKWE